MPIYKYRCEECSEVYNQEPKNSVCSGCGGLVNKISRFDIKIQTLGEEDIELLKGQLRKDSYTKVVYA